MKLYLHYVMINLRSMMQYKMSFFLTTLGQLLVSFSAFLGTYFLFARFHEIQGFSFSEVLLCFSIVLMQFSLAEMVMRGLDSFSSIVRNGTFDRILIRPRSTMLQVLGEKFELTRIGRLIQAIVIFVYAVRTAGVIWTPARLLTLLLMLICGIGLFTDLFMIHAALCFWTLEGLEFMNVLTDGAREFGMYPLSVYGERMMFVTTYMVPYALIQYYPLLFLLGRADGAFYCLSPLLSLLFFIPAYALWRLGIRHYQSSGS